MKSKMLTGNVKMKFTFTNPPISHGSPLTHDCHKQQICSGQPTQKMDHPQCRPVEVQGVKMYPCPFCPKVLTQNGGWHRHVRDFHLKLRPYKCPTCEMTFARKGTLKNHLFSIHKLEDTVVMDYST